MNRPSCVVSMADLPAEKRPRHTSAEGVEALVSSPGDATGLTQMGVHLRTVQPGFAGTNRHCHTVEEEWTYVLSGSGVVRIGPLRIPVTSGHFIGFVPGYRPHHFIAEGDAGLVLLEGGERRKSEDGGWYPDVRKMWRNGEFVQPYEEPPPEEGNAQQVAHIDDVAIKNFQHDVDSGAHRYMRVLHRPTGLTRQAVYFCQVDAGNRTTAFHTHDRTDEWVLILTGRGIARVGDATFEVGPNDFIGHAAGSAPHVMQATENLTYLMGGQIDATDVVTYPDAGLRRIGGRLEPLASV